jgi:hypothetical protein
VVKEVEEEKEEEVVEEIENGDGTANRIVRRRKLQKQNGGKEVQNWIQWGAKSLRRGCKYLKVPYKFCKTEQPM